MNIRTVNLVWEKRVRGSYAVSPHAVTDAGIVARALPRPLEPRSFDLVSVRPDESMETRVGFSVETLLKLDLTANADLFLGITADDLYLFHAGKKERFLHDKRILYTDAALSSDGKFVVCGFSDMAGGQFRARLWRNQRSSRVGAGRGRLGDHLRDDCGRRFARRVWNRYG